jgi:hypothetical protein
MSQPITTKGAEKLKEELKHLKSVERPRITKAIAEARAHGDLSENAEYHAAREQQSFTEGRINHIDSVLAEAQIIDVTTLDAGGKVVFGATVDLLNVETDDEVTYQGKPGRPECWRVGDTERIEESAKASTALETAERPRREAQSRGPNLCMIIP